MCVSSFDQDHDNFRCRYCRRILGRDEWTHGDMCYECREDWEERAVISAYERDRQAEAEGREDE
jgi:hypothetical protein